MASRASLCLVFALFACFFMSSSFAYTFYVGGKDGWVVNPSENYNQWAGRNRFSVNDTLVFKSKNGSSSVLLVNKDDYYNCNTKNPIKSLNSGTSVFQFDRSGPFFFITGNQENCQKGQRLIAVVLAIRTKPTPGPTVLPHPPAISPKSSSASPPLAHSPTSPSPIAKTPSLAPSLSPKSPKTQSPSLAPTPALSPKSPETQPPSLAPTPTLSPKSPKTPSPFLAPTPALSPKSPKAKTPSLSPSPSTISRPALSPTKAPSPAVANPPYSSSPSPAEAEVPATSPSSSSPAPSTETNEPSTSPESARSSSPNNGNSANATSPAPPGSGSWSLAPPLTVSVIGSLVLGSYLLGV